MIESVNHIAEIWFAWEVAMFWQVAIVITIATVIDTLIKRWAWPQIRYALWMLVLIKLVLPPSLTSPVSLTSPLAERARGLVQVQVPLPTNLERPYLTDERRLVGDGGRIESSEDHASYVESVTAVDASSHPLPRSTTQEAATVGASLSWKAYVLLAWIAGVIVLSTWLLRELQILRRGHLAEDEMDSLPKSWRNHLESAASRLGLKRLPKVVLSARVSSPAIFRCVPPSADNALR